MTDVVLPIAVMIALEVLHWRFGAPAAFVIAAIMFAFCLGVLWGASDMKRRMGRIEDTDR